MAQTMRVRKASSVALAAMLALSLGIAPSAARAETSEELKARLELAKSMLDQLDSQLVQAGEQLHETQYKLDQTHAQIDQTRVEVGDKEAQLNTTRDNLAKHVKASYKAGHRTPLAAVLDEKGLVKISSIPYYANKVAQRDSRVIQEVKDAKFALEEETSQLEALLNEQEGLVAEQQSQLAVLQSAEAAQAAYVDSLDQELKDLIEEEKEEDLRQQRVVAQQAQAQLELKLTLTQSESGEQEVTAFSYDPAEAELAAQSPEAAAALSTMSNSTRLTILKAAFSQIGVPYLWGGEQPGVGLDCSGFTQYCYRQAGIELPHSAVAQSVMAREATLETLQPGDLVFWIGGTPTTDHVAMYIGGGNIIHSSTGGVRIIPLYDGWSKVGSIV